MNEPNSKDAYRCFEIRCRSKEGKHVSEDEHRFCEKMWKEFPEWYSKQEREVFNATVPVGSNAHIDEDGTLRYGGK